MVDFASCALFPETLERIVFCISPVVLPQSGRVMRYVSVAQWGQLYRGLVCAFESKSVFPETDALC